MSGRVRLNARHLLLKLFSLQAPKMELEGLDGERDVIGNRSENEKARWTQAERALPCIIGMWWPAVFGV
jgi:hypothetical protein